MGIGKFAGEYVEEMTEPAGWPDIDETELQERAAEFLNMRNQIEAVVTNWRQQQGQVFEGGIWVGQGADAGRSSIQQRVGDMTSLQEHLGKAFAFYTLATGVVEQTKMAVNANLQNAQQIIQDIRQIPNIDDATKNGLIQLYVAWQNIVNSSEVSAMSGKFRHLFNGHLNPHRFPHQSRHRLNNDKEPGRPNQDLYVKVHSLVR